MRCRRYFAAAKRRAVALPSRLPSSSLEGGGRSIPSRYRISHLLAKASGCEQRAETFKRHAVDRPEIIGLCQRATGPSARAQQSGGTIRQGRATCGEKGCQYV